MKDSVMNADEMKAHKSQFLSSLMETHRGGFRLLKVVSHIDRDLLPLSMLQATLTAAIPFVSLAFGAQIIDRLLNKAFENLWPIVGSMILTVFILNVLNTIIQYKTTMSQKLLQTNLEIALRAQCMNLEYEIVSDAELQQVLRNAEDAAKYQGGLGDLVLIYKNLLQYCLSAVTALVFTGMLCFSRGTLFYDNVLLQSFSNPAVSILCLIFALVLGMGLSSSQAKKIKAIENHIAEQHYAVENQLSYWINGVLHDTESGKTIRMNKMGAMILANVDGFMKRILPLFQSMGISANKRIFSEGFESGLFSLAAYGIVLVKVFTAAITTGAFTQYVGALMQFHAATSKIAWSESEVNRVTRNLLPLADFMARKNLKHTGTLHVAKRADHHFEIEFHNVSFCYPGSDTPILKNVNARIHPKSKLAVVGPNGAGKTTFIKLLCRLYDPTEGYITLNGIDIKKYSYEEYLALFGVVFQDFYLFSAGIGENVGVTRDYNSHKVRDVLQQSGISKFVEGLPKGLDTILENGAADAVDLSGGQAQKIAIARALYKDAPFVVLDEPTAALDPISESEIYAHFDHMVQNKTSVYISHRMSSCRFCDEVLVFDGGALVERGSHNQLVATEGLYSKLWNAQAQYYA